MLHFNERCVFSWYSSNFIICQYTDSTDVCPCLRRQPMQCHIYSMIFSLYLINKFYWNVLTQAFYRQKRKRVFIGRMKFRNEERKIYMEWHNDMDAMIKKNESNDCFGVTSANVTSEWVHRKMNRADECDQLRNRKRKIQPDKGRSRKEKNIIIAAAWTIWLRATIWLAWR